MPFYVFFVLLNRANCLIDFQMIEERTYDDDILCISVVLVIQTYGDLIKTIRRQTVIVEETNCLMIHCSIDIQLFNVSILNIVEVSKHGVIRQ